MPHKEKNWIEHRVTAQSEKQRVRNMRKEEATRIVPHPAFTVILPPMSHREIGRIERIRDWIKKMLDKHFPHK
jgi:hypothetical protein